jgi:hypothetical protein
MPCVCRFGTNIEGIVPFDDCVRLFSRGNGERFDGVVRVSATCDLAWDALESYLEAPGQAPVPQPQNIMQYDLGHLEGTRITFTDATLMRSEQMPQSSHVLYTGTAEASADVVLDGPVAGSVIGIIRSDGAATEVRWTDIRDGDGERLHAKVEGIALGDIDSGQIFVVVDADDHRLASELWEVSLTGWER